MWTSDKLFKYDSLATVIDVEKIGQLPPTTSRNKDWHNFVCDWVTKSHNNKKEGDKLPPIDVCKDENRVVWMRGSDGSWLNLVSTDASEIEKVPVKLEFLVLWRDGEWSLRGE
eukprot:GHVU01013370.1.p1 GENE.GHVU01013370.1~~GHVU01013370.1.p1  ORF type:complete len:113 (-),score=13.86 GHVU01013370.1:554-892(-)